MRRRDLSVWLDGQHVAVLRSPRPGRITCQYDDQVLDTLPQNSPLLSCSLPVRRGRQDAWAFCTGLLPEGRHREAMAAQAGVPAFDIMGMLERFGRDVAGAVVICPQQPPEREPGVAAYTDDELTRTVLSLDERPLALGDDSELSIAGLQDKMLLVELPDGGWGRPLHGYPSTHILKIDDPFHRGLVRAEHACLALASTSGLEAAPSKVITVGEVECVVVRRFDRAPSPADASPARPPRRLHQEDACQALGIDPEANARRAKYEAHGGPGFRPVARLLTTWASEPRSALLSLLDNATFTVAIGNADAHGKNLALLHPRPGELTLAPLYDTVPTALWPNLRTDAAMSIAGQTRLPDITATDLVTEATYWKLSPTEARQRVTQVLQRLHTALTEGLVDVDTRPCP